MAIYRRGMKPDEPTNSRTIREVAEVFLKLGATGFGGPVAAIAMMDEEVVHRRKWLSRERFM
ncbi:MAG: chromate transporter, partial [Candidatus Sumerlaeaceae bacterium]|nr:chromate transporter [Candidatus Sumerlaeaceae bacterium]